MKRGALFLGAVWIVAVHLGLAIALFRPHWLPDMGWRLGLSQPEPTAYVAERHAYLAAQDTAAGPADIVLIGDSHSELIDPASLPGSVRIMAAGGETIRNLATRIGSWSALEQAGAVFLWAGYNDLARRDVPEIAADFETALRTLPDGPLIFALSPVPVRDRDANAAVLALQSAYREVCEREAPCRWVDIATPLSAADGTLAEPFDSGDGVHLSPSGSRRVAALITAAVKDNNANAADRDTLGGDER